ncbi:uncharacterized protein LOC144098693 [Amblyomma americanum]
MNAWVLLAACCVLGGARAQYTSVRGHYGPALALTHGSAGLVGASPYAAGAYGAGGAGATQLAFAPAAAVFGHAQHQQLTAAPGLSAASVLGAGYGATYGGAPGAASVIVSPVLHQDGVAGLMPAGVPNFGRSAVAQYGGAQYGGAQVRTLQPTAFALSGAHSAAAGARAQLHSAAQLASGTQSTLYREPKALPSLSSLHQLQAAAQGATIVQEVGPGAQLGALQGYGGAATGLFPGYGASAAVAARPAAYTFGGGLRSYH